jgi:hypothetical protein
MFQIRFSARKSAIVTDLYADFQQYLQVTTVIQCHRIGENRSVDQVEEQTIHVSTHIAQMRTSVATVKCA